MIEPWIIFDDIPDTAKGFTYLIINNLTFKMYIGMKTFTKGWEDYFGSSADLDEDVEKYGKESFTRGVIRFLYNKEDLLQHEINLQVRLDVLGSKFLNETRMFYNRAIHNVGFSMLDPSDRLRKKLSDALKKSYEENPERAENHSKVMKKHYENPEAHQVSSDAQKQSFKDNPERAKNISTGLLETSQDPKIKKKRSEAQTKRFEDPEEHKKVSERITKRYEDPAARKKASNVQKKRYEDPLEIKKNSDAQKKSYKENSERTTKVSNAVKKRYEDPAARKKTSDAVKKRNEDPAQQKKNSDVQKKRYEDPAAKKKTSDAMKKSWEPGGANYEKREKKKLDKLKNELFTS
jgi:hypothetical protein